MKTLLIVWHSLTGGSRQMAEAAADGARTESAVALRLLRGGSGDDRLVTQGGSDQSLGEDVLIDFGRHELRFEDTRLSDLKASDFEF